MNAALEFAVSPLIMSSGNHNVALGDLKLETVGKVAPFYFGLGQVLESEFLFIQVLEIEYFDTLCLRLDNVVIRRHDSFDLAYFIGADRKQFLV